MYVSGHRALRPRLAQHVRVAGIEALDGGAFVAGGERRDEVILKADEKHMAVERRPVLFGEMQLGFRIAQRFGMLAASGHEIVVIEDAVVFIRHQVHDDAEPFGVRHGQQVPRRVVQVAAIVHMDVSRAAPPARLRNAPRAGQPQRDVGCVARLHIHRRRRRLVFEPAHRFDRHLARRNLHRVFALCVEAVLGGSADAGVGVRGRVELAVRRQAVDASRLGHAYAQTPHGPLRVARRDFHISPRPAIGLDQRQPG